MFNRSVYTLKQLISFLIFILLFSSCTSEVKPITFKSTLIDTKYEADISVIYDKAVETNDIGKTINLNIEKAIISSLSNASKKTNLDVILKDFNSEYLRFKNDFAEDSQSKWELHIEVEKIYQSVEVITLVLSTYEFKGGAHGNDKIRLLNLNTKSGEILNQNAIIKNETDFKKLAQSHFIKSLKSEDKSLKIEDFFFGKPFQLPENIGFSDDGLVFLYNVYEVASFEQGYTEFVIPFKDVQPFLRVN